MLAPSTMGAGVPLYVHPGINGAPWADLAVPGLPVDWVVLNQFNGPGTTEDTVLSDVGKAVMAAGTTVAAYIAYTYGTRLDFNVFQDMDTWRGRGFSAVFLDQCPPDPGHIQSTATTVLGLRKHGARFVVLNPGVVPDPAYIAMADQTVIFEGTVQDWMAWTPPTWLGNFPPSRYAVVLKSVPDLASSQQAIARAYARGIRTVFCYNSPNLAAGNPYDGLPSYWPQNVKQLSSLHPDAWTG
ncbi:spherulation-specific family 4 protein [Kitasatospora viridis]|uniref:Spherulation-specific family 4 protein n=1 Tax=Kitasatospora viridis TaxID=281105 RepID=A0A561S9X5_9ACTN|nr:spherulation-specific family 4 protein [Kitasatospora viridis]TWF71683.1 spherulation-specific family 4 protein [Kitasatospora viridis]